MTCTELGDAFLAMWDRAVKPLTDDERARIEREQRVKAGKARQVVWLMKQEGMSR